MNYLILGAGGVGSAVAAALTRGSKPVTLIARSNQARAIRAAGLSLFEEQTGTSTVLPIDAQSSEDYHGTPDVIFVCVKCYSLPDTVPFLSRFCGKGTLIIPLLNGLDIAERLQSMIPAAHIVLGSISVFSRRDSLTQITLSKSEIRVMLGAEADAPASIKSQLFAAASDLQDCGIDVRLSTHPKEQLFEKFIQMSPRSAVGVLHNAMLIKMQTDEEMRSDYEHLLDELVQLGNAMGIQNTEHYRAKCLDALHRYTPTQCTSLYRDWTSGARTEAETILYAPVLLGRQYGLPMPTYQKVSRLFGYC